MLFVPTRIVTLGILPGFINSTIRNNWAIVASPKAITVVIQEVLKFESTLTKLSPNIRCDVSSGGCCRFTAGFQVARLKQALGSFHRVQSSRNLALSCWRLVVQLSLSASSPFVPRLGHPRCHSGPGSSLNLLLSGVSFPLSDSSLEASRAPSGTAHEEYSLQVSLFLRM